MKVDVIGDAHAGGSKKAEKHYPSLSRESLIMHLAYISLLTFIGFSFLSLFAIFSISLNLTVLIKLQFSLWQILPAVEMSNRAIVLDRIAK